MQENLYSMPSERIHKHRTISRQYGRHSQVVNGQEALAKTPYYWIWAIKDGRLVVTGPKDNEQEAYNWGYAKLGDVDFRVEMLPTRDMNSAVRMLKGKVLDKTANLDLSIKRARRKV